MAVDLKKLLGIPSQSPEEQKKEEVVKTPEFDLTKFAKGLVPIIAVVLGGVVAALKANGVDEVTEPAVLLGVLAVVTATVLGMSFLAAVDIAARAFLSGEGSAQKETGEGKEDGEKEKAAAAPQVVPMPPGALVWLKDDDRPLPLLAVAGSGTGSASYLVASGEVVKTGRDGEEQDAIKGAPKWEAEEKVAATKPSKWKP
jgi:hypothetical protein